MATPTYIPMDAERFEEFCAVYALGALDGVELDEFALYLRSATAAELKVFRAVVHTAGFLPAGSVSANPPPELRARILNSIPAPRKSTASNVLPESVIERIARALGFGNPVIGFGMSFALAMIVVVASVAWFTGRMSIRKQQQDISALRTELVSTRQRFALLETDYNRTRELLAVLESPRVNMVLMNGQTIAPSGFGKILWDPDKKTAILQIANVPPVPTDKDYQLWVIKDKKPISAGVFALSGTEKDKFFKIDRLVETEKQSIQAFAVTLEPKGGVPQPTGAMYLVGSLTP